MKKCSVLPSCIYVVLFLILLISSGVSISAYSDSATDLFFTGDYSVETSHNCRMYGAISNNFPDGLLQKQLINDSASLKKLSQSSNINGWGIVSYPAFSSNINISRGPIRAYNDPNFDLAVVNLNANEPKIIISHIRQCTQGCCAPVEGVNNPHPFTRYSAPTGKTWSFEHNGNVDKARLITLIGTEYLNSHGPFGSGVIQCNVTDPSSSLVVDSELYFLYVLKMIEENGGNAIIGITTAVKNMQANGITGAANFIMTDGETIYGFRNGNDLAYTYNATGGYSVVASQATSGTWTTMSNFQLVILKDGQTPVLINDVRTYVTQSAPGITSPTPANAAINIALNPNLQANITDAQGDSVDWTVQLYDGSTWNVLASGTEADGILRVNVPTTTITNYNKTYTWRVTARDIGTGNTTTATYTFTTKLANNAPTISNPIPVDSAVAVKINSTLSAYVEDKDGDLMSITFSINDGTGWKTITTLNNRATGTYSVSGNGYITTQLTNYQWRVNVVDSTGLSTESVYGFMTEGNYLTLKYNINIGNNNSWQIMPVMGDVDNDGIQEIVMSAGFRIVVVNGETGQIKWTAPDGASTAVELADVNNDGVLDILHTTRSRQVRALKGDGSVLWTSKNLPGEGQPVFPLLAYDIDGDGYPTIYFASEDQTPTTFSGNMSDYTGALTMLDHNGNVLTSTWLYHPCWGGLSMADPNADGNFAIYVSDRRSGYNGMTAAKGVQAYDAKTLKFLWSRGDIHSSSPFIMLDDVNKDGTLDVIAQQIIHIGVGVLNATSGNTLSGFDYFNKNLPTHAAGTVYDIDQDGNLEIINSVDDTHIYPKDFVVFDLVTGKEEFHPYYDFWVAWPPEVGDVTGDGVMEILAATGTQGNTGNFPLLIYDNKYNLIQNISITGAGQLMPAKVFDVDSDGLNEIVVTGLNGRLLVYDTPAPTPNPAPRTGIQRYSEYRRGAAEYVEPPGPKSPMIKDEAPADNSNDIPLGPTLSILTYDFQKDPIDIDFEINDGNGWQPIGSYNDVNRGTYSADTSGFVTEYDTQYQWRVTTDDGNGNINTKTFEFTTLSETPWNMPSWLYRKQIVIDHTKVTADLTNFPVLIDFTDAAVGLHAQPDGDDLLFTSADGVTKLNHEIETFTSTDGKLLAWVNIPFLSSTQDTILYMYYGNSDASNQQNIEGVWDSNYLAVHHLEEISGAVTDSTSNNNDGTPLNGVSQNIVGKINGGDQFDGSNDRTQLPKVFNSETQFTIEGWINSESKQGYAISQWASNTGAFLQYYPPEGNFQFWVNYNAIKISSSSNNWHYVVGTYDGTTARLYVDAGTPATSVATLTWPNLNTYIGDRSTFDRQFKGKLDEVRISNIARSQSYIATSYNNQNSPSTFISVGSEEKPVTKPIVSNENPENGAVDIGTNITELSFELTDNGNDLMNYTLTTTPNIGSGSGLNVNNGIYTVPISGLAEGTTYTWHINVTDGVETTHKTYTFDTVIPIPPIIVDNEFDDSADSAALRANSATQDWYESRAQAPTLLTLNTDTIGDNSGKKAKFDASSTTNAYLTQEFSEPQTSNFSVSWDIYVDSILDISSPDRAGWMLIGDDTTSGNGPSAADGERFVYMGFFKNGGGTSGTMDLVAVNRTGSFSAAQTVASGLNLKQWYNIRVDLNLTSDTYDVYIDGVFQKTVTSRIAKTQVTHISFAQWNDGAGSFYVDNVYVPAKEYVECENNNDCDDGIFCNGAEQCIANSCEAGTVPVIDDGLFCTVDSCDEDDNSIVNSPITVDDNVSCTTDVCDEDNDTIKHTTDNTVCDDTLFCNGAETCDAILGCQAGTTVDCSANDLTEIATCSNIPDDNIFTWDYAAAFDSVCDEDANSCTSGTQTVTSKCSATTCGAECDINNACPATECDQLDACVGADYYDYTDMSNNCGTDCACTDTACTAYTVIPNDPRCGECISDNDCNALDKDYCDGTAIKHDEGKCDATNKCTTETITINDCDDGLYCNGLESCSDAACIAGTMVDCSGSSLDEIATCNNNPDNNPLTWDYAAEFASTCDEDANACTIGAYDFTHTCDASCGAGCVLDANCTPTECDTLDGCVGTNYLDYSDVANTCSGCACTVNMCGLPINTSNDPRCKPALIVDSDFEASIDSNDLRANASTQDWYDSRAFFPTGSDTTLITLNTSDILDNVGKKARLKNNAGVATNAYLSQEFGYTPNSTFNLSFDIYIESIEDSGTYDRTGNVYIGDNSVTTNAPTGGNAERMVVLGFYDSTPPGTSGSDLQLRALPTGGTFGTTSSWTSIANNLSYDTWYRIKLVINPTGTYDIYVNDAPAYTGMTRFTLTATAKYISFVADSDARGEFYIDNVYSPAQGYVHPACTDNDGDAYGENCAAGPDCNDNDNTIHPGAADALCNGIDNDCDLATDEDYVVTPTSCGIGACASDGQMTCSAGSLIDTCEAGLPAADDTTCDNVDDDCNGFNDEDYVNTATSCGMGVCDATGLKSCIEGAEVDSCTPESPTGADNDCNGIDENCDGTADNFYITSTTSCGIGACSATGSMTCTAGVETNTCSPGPQTGSDDDCDNIDDNCDGTADNNYTPTSTSCGMGVCASTGEKTCVAGTELDSCIIGPQTGADNDCNGIDENCDGTADDGFLPLESGCGLGACASTGLVTCVEGSTFDSCIQLDVAEEESCDDIDNDCDGITDESLWRDTTCGVGACAGNTGTETCSNGNWAGNTCDPFEGASSETCDGTIDNNCDGNIDENCSCTSGQKRPCGTDEGVCIVGEETCTALGTWGECVGSVGPSAEICDNSDNDCDGETDEGIATTPTTCGVGACSNNEGELACINGEILDTCDPYDGAIPEICDNEDNDCDGSIDNDISTVPTTCGLGACSGNTGLLMCLDGEEVDSCNPLFGAILETCDGTVDQDCDGTVDEGCLCTAGDTRDCGDTNVGECSYGVETCDVSGSWSSCVGYIGPATEVCDTLDNDCDGIADEDNVCTTDCGNADIDNDGDVDRADLLILANNFDRDDCVANSWCESADTNKDGSVSIVDLQTLTANFGKTGCTITPVCGNGILDLAEECDDNNTNNNDGCSFTCSIESGWGCNGEPSVCTIIPEEVCDGIDNDGDGQTDENLTEELAPKQNGICAGSVMICQGINGWTASYPPSYEEEEITCDGKDNDCDGTNDEDLTAPLSNLQEGVCEGHVMTCTGTTGWLEDYTIIPNYETEETNCDGIDNDCDGEIDEGVQTIFYQDNDEDFFGNPSTTTTACTRPVGYLTDNTDCDDTDSNINPGMTEICGNGKDEDCDGTDTICPVDTDGDGTPDASDSDDDNDGVTDVSDDAPLNPQVCTDSESDMCDDCSQNPTSMSSFTPWPEYTPSPLADGSDNDGDGICNIGDTCTDIDDDSYCDETDDCDDNNATINPGASDSNCNGIDENCDGVADNEYVPILTSCGQGICAATGQAICTLGVETDTCAIGLPTTEICGNGIDEDCNGADLVCLLVDSDFDSSIDSDDLRLNATTQDWYESRHFWANGDQTLLTLDTNDIAGNTGKKARLKNNVGVATNAYLSQEFGYTPTSSFNLSFDIYIESIENSGTYNRTGNIYIGDNSATTNAPTGGNAERMAVLSFYDSTPDTTGTDIQLRALPTGGTFATTSSWTLIADNLSYDKWYKIKLVINPTGTYDIYINDAQAYTGMTRFTLTATAKYISFVADSDARGEFYIDNVYSPAQGYVPPACIDNDLDGYGNNCALGIDCNDANSAINPEATEICDNIDNDCDGSTDEELPKLSFYQDLDGDKYGNSAILLEVCQAPIGYTADSSDCNDTNAAIYPEATEICDNIDNDCDTEIDEEDVCGPTTETSCIDGIDNDGDTLTDCADSDCSADPACHVIVCGDGNIEGTETCDDGDTSSNDGCSDTCAIESGWTCSEEPSICTEECIPSAELCDGIDNDCNALTPDGSDEAWLGQSCDGTDSDLCAEGVYTCSGVQSCSDISPDNVEVCGDGLDQDCSGADLICLLVDSTFEASADDATLRANGAGQDWYESRGQAPTLLTLDTTNVGGNTGKKAKFDASNTTNAYVTQEFSTPQIGTFSIKWDIYIDNISDISSPDRAGWMLVGDDSTAGSGPNAANGERFVYMGFYKNGGGTSGTMDLIAVNRTGTFTAFQTIASGLNMKQWYNIRVDLNLTSDTYDVYVNDVFAATVTSRIAKTQVTHISFAQWNDGAGTFYIDNVYSPALT